MEITSPEPLLPGPLGVTASANDDDAAASASAADFNSFLTLLTAQLRNQDPLSPLDATEFVAQLASFSSVEQLVSVNERLDGLAAQAALSDIAGFSSWVGRDVALADGVFSAQGSPVNFALTAPESTEQVIAEVTTAAGDVVASFALPTGTTTRASWDGLSADGAAIHADNLTIGLRYVSEGEVARTATAEVFRRVTGLGGTADGPVLEFADGGTAHPHQISRLSEAADSSPDD